MTDVEQARFHDVIDAIASSGFPLQTAIAKLVGSTPPYELVHEEYPWKSETGATQFLDIIARHGAAEFPIECKKTETQSWIFLLPDECATASNVRRFRALSTRTQDTPTSLLELHVGDWDFEPASSESKFCIISGSSKRGAGEGRLIEPDAQLLVGAADAYA